MDPENVKEFGSALEGEEVLVSYHERFQAKIEARIAVDPSTVLDEFDLSESDRAHLARPETMQIIRESTAEQAVNGVYGWADDARPAAEFVYELAPAFANVPRSRGSRSAVERRSGGANASRSRLDIEVVIDAVPAKHEGGDVRCLSARWDNEDADVDCAAAGGKGDHLLAQIQTAAPVFGEG